LPGSDKEGNTPHWSIMQLSMVWRCSLVLYCSWSRHGFRQNFSKLQIRQCWTLHQALGVEMAWYFKTGVDKINIHSL